MSPNALPTPRATMPAAPMTIPTTRWVDPSFSGGRDGGGATGATAGGGGGGGVGLGVAGGWVGAGLALACSRASLGIVTLPLAALGRTAAVVDHCCVCGAVGPTGCAPG